MLGNFLTITVVMQYFFIISSKFVKKNKKCLTLGLDTMTWFINESSKYHLYILNIIPVKEYQIFVCSTL